MKFVTDFDAYWREKGPLIIAEIRALHPTAATLDASIDLVLKRYTADLKPRLLRYFSMAYANKLTVLHSELPKTFRVSARLSTTINKHLKFTEIRRDIKAGFKASESVYRIAQTLRDKGVSKAVLPGYLKDITSKAKDVARLGHDSKEFLKFKSGLAKAQKRIDKLVNPSTSTLKRAYQEVLEKATNYSKSSYDKAVQYAIKAKQKYQTERLVINEATRAYTEASQADLRADTDAIGWRSVLSGGGSACDICVDKAIEDNYDLGPGGFPKRIPIGIPYHPSCQCSAEKIYR